MWTMNEAKSRILSQLLWFKKFKPAAGLLWTYPLFKIWSLFKISIIYCELLHKTRHVIMAEYQIREGGKNCTHSTCVPQKREGLRWPTWTFSSPSHTLSQSASVFSLHYSTLPSSLLCPENLCLNKKHGSHRLVCRYLQRRRSLSFLLSPLFSALPSLIRVNEMVPFTRPIWARPWNTPCFVERWRGMTRDLQKSSR